MVEESVEGVFPPLVCLDLTPFEATQWGAQYVCVLFSARQIPARWSGLVCVRSGESEEKAERMREERKRLPSLPFLMENGGNPLWAVLNFFVEILS